MNRGWEQNKARLNLTKSKSLVVREDGVHSMLFYSAVGLASFWKDEFSFSLEKEQQNNKSEGTEMARKISLQRNSMSF